MQKIGFKPFFTAIFLAAFIFASIFLVGHNFSHKVFSENSVKELSQQMPENKGQSHDPFHCSFCFLSNVQNNTILVAAFIFAASSISIFLNWREFTAIKLAYFSSEFFSRAPPQLS